MEEGKLNDFMDYVGELIVTGEMYNHLQESLLDENVSDEFTQDLQSTNQAFQELSSDLQESLLEIRETPIENHLQKYPVMVRKAIGDTRKDIEVSLEGEDTAVDSELIEKLEVPLTTLIRYLVEESIDTTDRREDQGKSPQAEIELAVSRVGEEIVIGLRTDGEGVDEEALREQGPQIGMDPDDGAITENQMLNYMFRVGLDGTPESPTAPEDSLIDLVEDLRGSIELERNDPEGIEAELTVPRTQSVIVVEGLLVESAGEEFIVPLESVIESLSTKKAQRTSVEDRGEAINLRGDIFPVHELVELLNLPSSGSKAEEPVVMILRNGGHEYALRVDRILGQQKVVVRELVPVFSGVDYAEGSAMMGSGEICLVLDVAGLAEVVRS